MSGHVRSYLGPLVAPSAMTKEEMEALRRLAWKGGVFDINIADPRLDVVEAQLLRNIGNRLWGKRP